jgi:hypothetical protein
MVGGKVEKFIQSQFQDGTTKELEFAAEKLG